MAGFWTVVTLGSASSLVLTTGAVDVAVTALRLGDASVIDLALEVAVAARHIFCNKVNFSFMRSLFWEVVPKSYLVFIQDFNEQITYLKFHFIKL